MFHYIHPWCRQHNTSLIDPHKSWIATIFLAARRGQQVCCVFVSAEAITLLCLCFSLHGGHQTLHCNLPGDLDVFSVCMCVIVNAGPLSALAKR